MRAARHAALVPPATGSLPRAASRPARRPPLAREVTVVLALKAVALVLLWVAFFRAPMAPRMAMEPGAVVDHVAAPPAATERAHAEP